MKRMIKTVLLALGGIVYNKSLLRLIKRIHQRLLWQMYSKEIGKLGKDSNVGLGLQLLGGKYMQIGDRFTAGIGLNLQAWDSFAGERFQPKLIIGNNVVLTDYIQISCANEIRIGNNVLMGQSVYISDNNHGNADCSVVGIPPMDRKLTTKGPVVIGDNVWIGRCSTILSGVTIGDNAIIGANSVVVKDVPPYAVVGGAPATVIRYLCPEELREKLPKNN